MSDTATEVAAQAQTQAQFEVVTDPKVGDIAIHHMGVLTYIGMVDSVILGGEYVRGTSVAYTTGDGKFYGVSSDHYWKPVGGSEGSVTFLRRQSQVEPLVALGPLGSEPGEEPF